MLNFWSHCWPVSHNIEPCLVMWHTVKWYSNLTIIQTVILVRQKWKGHMGYGLCLCCVCVINHLGKQNQSACNVFIGHPKLLYNQLQSNIAVYIRFDHKKYRVIGYWLLWFKQILKNVGLVSTKETWLVQVDAMAPKTFLKRLIILSWKTTIYKCMLVYDTQNIWSKCILDVLCWIHTCMIVKCWIFCMDCTVL